MAAIWIDPRLNVLVGKNKQQHGVVVDEIEGLIMVYQDGHVERPPIVPSVPCTSVMHFGITAKDVVIENYPSLWVRIYVPNCHAAAKLPLLVYFHGGGFCVGSASWSCYHDFLSKLAYKASCVIVSVNYRLAPEHRLPAAYEDGIKTLRWVKQQALHISSEHKWWSSHSNFSSLFLAGDSAGGNIAYNVAIRLGSEFSDIKPLSLKGIILIQPFLGGEARKNSEKNSSQPPNSALSLQASDAYWRLSLPLGSNRDHPWCNPLRSGASEMEKLKHTQSVMVCISEMDILKDRNMEICNGMGKAGKKVKMVMCKGVGHAFQVLKNSHLAEARIKEMMSHLKSFINQ